MQFVMSIDESIIIDYGILTANGIRGDIFTPPDEFTLRLELFKL